MSTLGRNLVQGVELWTPNGELLVLEAGAYGEHSEFARVSGKSRFHYGEGLPGAVWANLRPIFWRDLGVHFVRRESAAEAGIDGALGLPWFSGGEFSGVLVFLLSRRFADPACLELWEVDQELKVLRHAAAHYSACPEFERLSPLLQFPRSTGLPGLTWALGLPFMMEDVRSSNEFIRAGIAARSGLKRGIGVPFYQGDVVACVLTLITGEQASFVRLFEIFVDAGAGTSSEPVFERRVSTDPEAERGRPTESVAHVLKKAASTGLPSVAPAPATRHAEHDSRSAHEIMLALPYRVGTQPRTIAYFGF